MPDYDAGFKIVAHQAGKELARLAGIVCQRWQPIGGEVQATERLADRAFLAQAGSERFIVYMEAYTRWQAAAPWSVLAKSGLLSERQRLPTVSLVYVLLPRGYRPQQGAMRLAALGAPTQHIWFQEICLWQVQPEAWWETAPGMLPIYPLCRHRRAPQEALTYAAGLITEQVVDRSVRADLLTTLGLFGRLALPGVDVFRLLGREQMKESSFYQEIMEEGRVEARQADIRHVLELRFGREEAAPLDRYIREINDINRLLELHALAVQCRRLAEFRKEVEPKKRSGSHEK